METSLKLQMDVKNNAEDLHRYMLDLNSWEEEMKQKEKELKNRVNKIADHPPPRNRIKRNSSEKHEDNKKFSKEEKKVKKIHAYDYSAWDKYDADKACAELDEETNGKNFGKENAENIEEKLPEEEKDAEDDTKSFKNIDEAFYEKELGNIFVKKEKWEDAIKCYTKAINLDSTNAIYYANRALCFIKLKNFKSAEVDATVAVQLDSTYIKAYQRRAVARKALGQHQEAISDYQEILRLEPKNAFANLEIIKLEKLNTSRLKIEEKKHVKPIFDPRTIFKTEPKWAPKEELPKEENPENVPKCMVKEKENIEELLGKCGTEKKIIELETHPVEKLDIKNSNEPLPGKKDVFGKIPEGFTVVKPVRVPPHLRSKKSLRRIPIKEVFSDVENVDEFINLSNNTTHNIQCPKENEKKSHDISKSVREKQVNLDNNLFFPVPVTCVQFQQAWKYVKINIESTFSYLKKIKTDNLSSIFQHSLESDLFSELLSSLANDIILKDHEFVFSFLYHLSEVQRFGSLVMFMSSSDKENLNKCITSLKENKSREEIEELCILYELKKKI